MSRLLVCGTRTVRDWPLFCQKMESAYRRLHEIGDPLTTVLTDCEPGPGAMAIRWALEARMNLMRFPAEWDRWGKSAAMRRNEQMLRQGQPTHLIAFHRPGSRGTAHMIRIARNAGVTCWVITVAAKPAKKTRSAASEMESSNVAS